ncbi:MAG: TolC family protein [Chitinophagales bacterium]
MSAGTAVTRPARRWPAIALVLAVGAAVCLFAGYPGGRAVAEGVSPAAGREEAALLSLADALALAEQNNPGYRRALLAVDQAQLALTRLRADQTVRAGALSLEQAEEALSTAQTAREAARRRLRLDVRRAFYTLFTAGRQQKVARDGLAQAEEYRRTILSRRKSGAGIDLDVLAAERAYAEAAAGVTRADTGAELAEQTLRDLLRWPAGRPLALGETVSGEKQTLPGTDEAIARALAASPEVAQARAGVAAAELAVKLAENDYTPDLVRRAAALKLEEARLALDDAEHGVALQVRKALADVRLAESAAQVAAKAESAAAEAYRAAKVRFDVGHAVADDLLTAQIRLYQARQAGLQASLDRDLAATAVLALIGE